MQLKQVKPGYYEGTHNGQAIAVYKSVSRGQMGGRIYGWNLAIAGVLVADWLSTKKGAIAMAERECK